MASSILRSSTYTFSQRTPHRCDWSLRYLAAIASNLRNYVFGSPSVTPSVQTLQLVPSGEGESRPWTLHSGTFVPNLPKLYGIGNSIRRVGGAMRNSRRDGVSSFDRSHDLRLNAQADRFPLVRLNRIKPCRSNGTFIVHRQEVTTASLTPVRRYSVS